MFLFLQFAFFYKILYYTCKLGDHEMLVFGKNVLKETNPMEIKKVYLNQAKKDQDVFQFVKEHHYEYEFVDRRRLDEMVSGNHQGVVIDVKDYVYSKLEDAFSSFFVLILDHIEDPHNLGAIIRTAEAAGISYLIIPKDRAVAVNSTVVKTSAGAISRVHVIMVSNINQAIKKLQDQGFFVYAADMNGEDYRTCNYDGKKALIIGNEGSGVSPLVKKNSDIILSIPMLGKINSLNASVAAGILIFAMVGETSGL